MTSAFPFPTPTPPQRRLSWSSWAVSAGILFLLIVIAVIAMSVAQQ